MDPRNQSPGQFLDEAATHGIALPSANAKVEGALVAPTPVGSTGASLTLGPDGFFDGTLFDPDQLEAYIEAQRR